VLPIIDWSRIACAKSITAISISTSSLAEVAFVSAMSPRWIASSLPAVNRPWRASKVKIYV
jgi:hypothetical protein